MKSIKPKSLFSKWILSYAIILIIPIILGVAILSNARTSVINEYQKMNQLLQQQTSKILDKNIKDLNTLRNQLLTNEDLISFSFLKGIDIDEKRYNLVQIQNKMQTYEVPRIASKYYLYLFNIDMVLTVSSLYSKELTLELYHNGMDMPQDEWFDYLRQYHSGTIYVADNIENHGNQIMMISSMPNLSSYTPRVAIVQIFEEDAFSELLKGIVQDNNTTLEIVDDKGNTIASSNAVTSFIDSNELSGNNGFFEYKNDTKGFVFYSTSVITNWKYVTIITMDTINSKTQYIKTGIFGFIIFSLILGGFLAYSMAKMNYNPVKKIAGIISKHANQYKGDNEYLRIEDAFNNIIKSNEELNELWKKQNYILQNNFIKSVLSGRIDNTEQTRDVASTFDINFTSDYFCVFIFSLLNEGFNDEEYILFIDEVFNKIARHIREIFDTELMLFPAKQDDMLSILVNFSDKDTIEETYQSLCEEIEKVISTNSEIIIASVSELCKDLSSVYLSYYEAMRVISSTLFNNNDEPPRLILHGDEPDEKYSYTIRQEELIINYMSSGNTKALIDMFDNICWYNFSKNKISFVLGRCLFLDLSCSAIKAINNSQTDNSSLLEQIESMINDLNKAQTIYEMSKITKTILQAVTERLLPNKTDSTPVTEAIIRCVKQHFTEYDFNVSKVADYLSMNMSYLSKYFKDNTGIGMHDYINQIRINYAKELILKGGATITDIAHQIGFENYNSFIRVFKKIEGITPGSYSNRL